MRLIDADALLEKVKESIKQYAKHRDILRLCADVKGLIMSAPTIEAEPVVRCKDCKHYHNFEIYFDCNHAFGMDYVQPNDFCSYGEKRTD